MSLTQQPPPLLWPSVPTGANPAGAISRGPLPGLPGPRVHGAQGRHPVPPPQARSTGGSAALRAEKTSLCSPSPNRVIPLGPSCSGQDFLQSPTYPAALAYCPGRFSRKTPFPAPKASPARPRSATRGATAPSSGPRPGAWGHPRLNVYQGISFRVLARKPQAHSGIA